MPHRLVKARTRPNARRLRHEMTDAETRLWSRLRAHRFSDFSFRRQTPIGPYIVDFVCLDARLIVEVDGGQHADNLHDVNRDEWLREQGFAILRFWNSDVFGNLAGVLESISTTLTACTPPSLTLPRKGGGNTLRQKASA
jgi:very-short-patch-repair endonuclease